MAKNLLVIFIIILNLSCGKSSRNEPTVKKPNIILFLADDQGWGDLSSSGNNNLCTPNIDALKTNGATFNNFYVQPVCSPTRAEILTGRYFIRTGVYETSSGGERINMNETTIAEILKKADYHTAAFGKWHNGMQPPYHPNSKGFDEYYGFASGHWGNYFSPMLEYNGALVKGNGFLVDALNFLSDANDDEDLQFTRAALAMVENIDYHVGRITDKIKKLNLEDNTIIIYLSDYGPNAYRWNGNMKGKKGSVDEGGVRTPFYIQWTKHIPKGLELNEIAGGIDILPTLCGLLSIPYSTEFPVDGEDLSALLLGNKFESKDRFLFNHWNGKTSVRSQKYRLDNENRLYDITLDRAQKNDISNENPNLANKFLEAKRKWENETITTTKQNDDRAFTLGYSKAIYTQLPARDGEAHGTIERSNRWPNDSFFTNWNSVNDSITWNVDVLEKGNFQVEMYYTCPPKDLGSVVELSFGDSKIKAKIIEAFDSPLVGKEHDRVLRMESYVKEFKPLNLGIITLPKGKGTLTLKALEMPNKAVADFRLLQFKKVD